MTIKTSDRVVLRPGGKAQYRAYRGGPLQTSQHQSRITPDTILTVQAGENGTDNVRVFVPGPYAGATRTASIHRGELHRVFAGNFREGDAVLSVELGITGRVIDQDPAAEEIDRAGKVPIQIVTRNASANELLKPGEVVYTDPSYIRKQPQPVAQVAAGSLRIAPLPKLPDSFPRVELKDWLPEGGSVAFGGQGGAGGIAIGAGAVGGRGGNGGSAHFHIPADVQVPVSEPAQTDTSPAYKDITDEIDGQWSRVQVGDIVTAKHRTQARGGEPITNERTSAVVKGSRGWADSDVFWAELNLTMHTQYDAHKISRVLRLQKARLLSERRKPLQLTVTRLVPADHVWRPTTLRCDGPAYVEADMGGSFWLVFEGGENSGKRLRLKEGRDSVQYESIPGTYVVRENFESLVALTHNPE